MDKGNDQGLDIDLSKRLKVTKKLVRILEKDILEDTVSGLFIYSYIALILMWGNNVISPFNVIVLNAIGELKDITVVRHDGVVWIEFEDGTNLPLYRLGGESMSQQFFLAVNVTCGYLNRGALRIMDVGDIEEDIKELLSSYFNRNVCLKPSVSIAQFLQKIRGYTVATVTPTLTDNTQGVINRLSITMGPVHNSITFEIDVTHDED